MSNVGKTQAAFDHCTREPPPDEKQRLLERYGDHLDGEDLSETQKKEVLMALWQIMRGFAEMGISVKTGDKFCSKSDIGMDDVLRYIIPEDTAPETLAPFETPEKKEPL